MLITSILGETKEVVHTWPDGSFQCPHCCSPVVTPNPRCDNPACAASKWATPANKFRFEEAAREHAENTAREAARKRSHEIAMQRIAEDNAARTEAARLWFAKVREAGGCLRCSNQYHNRVRRHRNKCPKAAQ